VEVSVWINIPIAAVRLYLSFSYDQSGFYDFLVVLPFQTKGLANASCGCGVIFDWPLNSTHVHATSSNIAGYSAIEIGFSGTNYGYQKIALDMQSTDTMCSGSRGNDIFYFPTGLSPLSFYQAGGMKNYSQFPFIAGPSTYSSFVQVGISNDSVLNSGYPPSYFFSQSNDPVISRVPTQWFSWNFSRDPRPITLQYTDTTVSENYGSDLFTGGILIGIGVSVVAAVALDAIQLWTRQEKG
jgi:hypothetical protein